MGGGGGGGCGSGAVVEFEDRLYAQTQKQIKTQTTQTPSWAQHFFFVRFFFFSISCRHGKCALFGSRKVLLMLDTALSPAKLPTSDQSFTDNKLSQVHTGPTRSIPWPNFNVTSVGGKTDLCTGFVTNWKALCARSIHDASQWWRTQHFQLCFKVTQRTFPRWKTYICEKSYIYLTLYSREKLYIYIYNFSREYKFFFLFLCLKWRHQWMIRVLFMLLFCAAFIFLVFFLFFLSFFSFSFVFCLLFLFGMERSQSCVWSFFSSVAAVRFVARCWTWILFHITASLKTPSHKTPVHKTPVHKTPTQERHHYRLTPSLPWCLLETTNRKILKPVCFLFRINMWKVFIKTQCWKQFCYRSGKFTVCRRVWAFFSGPEIWQAVAVKGWTTCWPRMWTSVCTGRYNYNYACPICRMGREAQKSGTEGGPERS